MKRIVKWKDASNNIVESGNVYYLDTVNGDNGNNGLSTITAWDTYEYAQTQMDNGDVLLNKPTGSGVYAEIPTAYKKTEYYAFKMGGSMHQSLTVLPEVSRYSGVAPLSVHFLAGWQQGDEEVGDFHTLDYTWDFGDTSAGTWQDGASKNSAKGAVAAHIYETSGNYTATVTVKQGSTTIRTETFNISVNNANTYYSGTATTCVNPAGDSDFTGAPSGCRQVQTNDLSTITQYATTNSRVLLKRGCSWTITSSLSWPTDVTGVTIGAYGTGTNPDARGIFDNNPYITVVGDVTFWSENLKQDCRLMDIEGYNYDSEDTEENERLGRYGFMISGSYSMQRNLVLRVKTYGFDTSCTLSHYNTSPVMMNDQLVIANCDFENAWNTEIYIGAERLAVLGNNLHDTRESHVIRIWQNYRGVMKHNYCSGSSLGSNLRGESALKFHGPYETQIGVPTSGTTLLEHRSQYAIVSDNLFGGSGPWPVGIGPQNSLMDERLSNIICERNRFLAGYGTLHSREVHFSVHFECRWSTVRNNIIDGTENNPGNGYYGIHLSERAGAPGQEELHIYNNTIYSGANTSNAHYGIWSGSWVVSAYARNNLISFPNATGTKVAVYDDGDNIIESNNLLVDDPDFVDPSNATPILRDFHIEADSEAVGAGTSVSVWEDFEGNARPNGTIDVGAYEYYAQR